MSYEAQVGPIPAWVDALEAPGYVNPRRLVRSERLHPTEAHMGDYGGRLLIVLQDFAPAARVRDALARGFGERAWRHGDGDARYGRAGPATNRALAAALLGDPAAMDGRFAQACGIVCANACWLLKGGDSMSGALVGFRPGRPAFEAGAAVLRLTVAAMRDLAAVALCSRPAWAMEGVVAETAPDVEVLRLWHPNAQGQREKKAATAAALRATARRLGVGRAP